MNETGDQSGMVRQGRPPRVDDDELIDVVDSLTTDERPVCETSDVAAELPMSGEGMRERLKRAADDDDVPIRGLQPGGQGGYVWWTIPSNLD